MGVGKVGIFYIIFSMVMFILIRFICWQGRGVCGNQNDQAKGSPGGWLCEGRTFQNVLRKNPRKKDNKRN